MQKELDKKVLEGGTRTEEAIEAVGDKVEE